MMRPKLARELKRQILERDKHRCVMCWRKYQINVHHFWDLYVTHSPYSSDIKNSDLVTLCDSCHGKVHTCDRNSPFYKFIEGYLNLMEKNTKHPHQYDGEHKGA
jgi:hypothetical protein